MTLEQRREEIRERYAHFFSPEDALRHPLYAGLCAQASSDDTLVDILLDTPEAQARPNLLLAALHDLALEDPNGELAANYPTAAHFSACSQSRPPLPHSTPVPSVPSPRGSATTVISSRAEWRVVRLRRMRSAATPY